MDESLSNWTIREAIKEFCFKARIEDINNCEHYFRSQQLVHFGFPNLGGASNAGEETPCHPHTIEEVHRTLEAAWANALLDLKTRIEREDLSVSGFQTLPDLRERREQIPNQWAMDFDIDPLRSVVSLRDRRYVNVLLEPRSKTGPATGAVRPIGRNLNSEAIAGLDDETILKLLEAHAQRVVENDTPLIAPGKVTLLPIIRRKMRWRAKNGEMLSTLIAESEWLARWMTERAGSFQLPTAPTIAKLLSKEYELLKPRSTTAIQTRYV